MFFPVMQPYLTKVSIFKIFVRISRTTICAESQMSERLKSCARQIPVEGLITA